MKYIGICAAPEVYLYRALANASKELVFESETQYLSFIVKLAQDT